MHNQEIMFDSYFPNLDSGSDYLIFRFWMSCFVCSLLRNEFNIEVIQEAFNKKHSKIKNFAYCQD